MTNQSAKRVNIVSLKLVKESSMLYKNRCVRSPEDGYQLLKLFLGDVDREYFVVVCLDTKNLPTAINICHIGSLNANRLEHSINNLNTSFENFTAAESRIHDVDMAKEMVAQTKNSIVSHAAQANQQPQGVLQLLR